MNQRSTEEDIYQVIIQLKDKEKQLITHFDPYIDMGRIISSQEIKFRVTQGEHAFCAPSTFYTSIRQLIDNRIISKSDGSSDYMITGFGWRIRKAILGEFPTFIPKRAKEQRDLLIYRISRTHPFTENQPALRTWSEAFSIYVKSFSNVLIEVGEETQAEFINTLGLIIWNSFYQPLLITNEDYIEAVQLDVPINQSRIFVICKYFGWEYYILKDRLWFVCKDQDFWSQRYKELFRFYMSKPLSKKKVRLYIKKSGDINNQTREMLKGAPPSRHISKKVFSRLTKEILFQKGHNWSKKYRNDPSWIYPRLEVILLRKRRDIE